MININGSIIKQLREQQGLTQLYLATVVGVTTDTISRWENKRYPSIKRDNGLKLAEALNVQLEDLIENAPDNENTAKTGHPELSASKELYKTAASRLSRNMIMFILTASLVCIVITYIWFFVHPTSPHVFSATRIVPANCIDGQPFPVVIEITGAPETATAIILKESLPLNATIHATSPKIASGALKNNQIRWLKKINSTEQFAYVLSISGNEMADIGFSGTAALSHNSEVLIDGQNTITVGLHHWADTNKDNTISDDEILTVYDQYTEIDDIDLDIDLIEEIWLGSEYHWDDATGTYKIID